MRASLASLQMKLLTGFLAAVRWGGVLPAHGAVQAKDAQTALVGASGRCSSVILRRLAEDLRSDRWRHGVRISVARLADEQHYSQAAVNAALASLVAAGLICRPKTKRRAKSIKNEVAVTFLNPNLIFLAEIWHENSNSKPEIEIPMKFPTAPLKSTPGLDFQGGTSSHWMYHPPVAGG